MVITGLTAEKKNREHSLHVDFSPHLTLVTGKDAATVYAAVQLLLNYRVPRTLRLPIPAAGEYIDLTAAITAAEKKFRVTAEPCGGVWLVRSEESAGSISMQHCLEEDAANIYVAGITDFSDRLHRYMCAGDYYPSDSFAAQTNGIGSTERFRTCLHRYVENIASEHSGEAAEIYQQRCFLETAEFWSELERERDLHYEPKPLLILNPQVKSVTEEEIMELKEQMISTNRQAILCLPSVK